MLIARVARVTGWKWRGVGEVCLPFSLDGRVCKRLELKKGPITTATGKESTVSVMDASGMSD
jgi:hypothetical protein